MKITVRECEDGLAVVDGRLRLLEGLKHNGAVTVHNISTGADMQVHQVGYELLALTEEQTKEVETVAALIIYAAMK